MRRLVPLVAAIALLCGGVLLLSGSVPAVAQDVEPTPTYAFPTIPPFQVPGEFQTPGAQGTAGAVATVPPTPTPVPEPGSIRVVAADDGATDGRVSLARDVAVELILDNSGSMLQPLGDELRIDVAKRVLTDLVEETLPPGIPLALRVFGDTPDSCETELAVPLQPLDPAAMTAEIARLQSVNLVKTPIGAALERVADDLAGAAGPKIVVLVTDGEETCGGDPEAAIRSLRERGIDVRVNIVGFAVEDDALKEQFRAWAELGGGQYFDATGADDLGPALARAVQPTFDVVAAGGDAIASGVVDGAPVRVPAGTYAVTVASDPPQVFQDVVVAPGDDVRLTLRQD